MATAGDVILYDGVCGLCNRVVQAVLHRDPAGHFRFAALQSGFARRTLARHGKDPCDLGTMYVVVDPEGPAERLLAKSDAALHVLGRLGHGRLLGAVLRALPTRLRDRGYDAIVSRRYRLFGRLDACPVPGSEHRTRFIDG